ncbi:transcriptional regulator, LytTR family [Gracilibacillus ureilyticus]|uniref:Transcriptional regulator, LytTR family n=1 Tax=Gracilibacillus ureilyticus TaxID=531814 RepID=A0A1H9VUA7_9BACI|nr:LytTR family transcriptional regulator DNA-binding domain-containing protein [Gracilibacillus ureilyticus]SES24863.1 transcriptional regulator, LytTR family [Gracilibacillus ureilyticus]
MTGFILNCETGKSGTLPPISLSLNESSTTAIYSDTDMQAELIDAIQQNRNITVFNRKEGLYDRLTVMDNVTFYHKWFGCSVPLPEILVSFELQMCAKKPLKKCSQSEMSRVYYAKYFMMNPHPMVFQEPIHGVDIKTINTFINMLKKVADNQTPALILVSNMEHALLLSDITYKLQEKGLQEMEVDTGEKDEIIPETEPASTLTTAKLFKIPAKIEDKVILFDPMEIDYIESQDGKARIVINHESFSLDSTLAEIEKKLEVYGFYRCHRSYIVNLQKVREIITWSKNTYSLRMDNPAKSTIPLSRTKIQGIQDMFNLK